MRASIRRVIGVETVSGRWIGRRSVADPARRVAERQLGDLWRALGVPADRATLAPREACFAFGLASLRPGRQARCRPDPDLAARLAEATPQDCLDAAFALRYARPSDVVGIMRGPRSMPPPFRDVDYFGAIARWLGCPFDSGPALRAMVKGASVELLAADDGAILRTGGAGARTFAIAPSPAWLPTLASLVARCPSAAGRLVVVPPHAIAAAAVVDGPNVSQGRLEPLHEVPRLDLADRVITRRQAAAFAVVIAALVAGSALAPAIAMGVTLVVFTAILLGYAFSRAAAIASPTPGTLPHRPLKASQLPDYSVLVPLYKEDGGLAHLVRGLRRLDYPQDKLDIQFLVEADDTVTQAAVLREASALPSRMTIVPPGAPRTKPRALNVGLRQARGSLVTIFDAEDRPDPRQLRLAAETFAMAAPDLAALQARLSIDHLRDNWLTRMFAIEYACLFDHIMPMVAARGRLVLLGGTSNHFRTEALIRAGGWDPFNVTEDADLAVRLRRFGFRIAMIDSETWEEAPVTIDAWLKQRSRWFKGYIQTWLVHNRRPLHLVRSIGLADAAVFHLFIIGALTAALAHLLFLVQIAAALGGAPMLFGGSPWLVALQVSAVLVGYGASMLLGAVSARRRKRERISPWAVLHMPAYWVLMGCAVVIAIHDIIRKPHHWRKTTHGVAVRPGRVGGPARVEAAGRPVRRAAVRGGPA